MPKAYRKPHITMNRPTYPNKVRVVRQSKALPKFVKPSVLDLKRIYSKLTKCPIWQRVDVIAEAIQWYRTVLAYAHNIAYAKTKMGYSIGESHAIKKFYSNLDAENACNVKENKVTFLLAAIKEGQYIAKCHGIVAPSPDQYLKKGKVVAKKLEKKEKESTTKYDKILTLLTQATAGADIGLKVSPTLTVDRKFESEIKTMYYSTKCVKGLKKKLFQEGLLSLVIQEAWHLAHAKAFQGVDSGVYIPSVDNQGVWFMEIMKEFEHWARTSQFAPKSLVRRPSKKKKEKVAA